METITTTEPSSNGESFFAASKYFLDAFQRSVLFWDVLRQRGNNYLKHKALGQPPVLQFEYETVLDGRTLDRPVNYALLKIKPEPGTAADPCKRPFVVVDPRAGHGPGIGGSKHDSQVGMALRAGHPVYFVTFFPEPAPGQKLRDVAAAEAMFIEEVARRHPQAQGKPCVIGNCQAGWAVAVLAAVRPEIMGPVILNGAPLSYWAGSSGQNPMRYSGGLMGGQWLESLACDLGNGLFDGAHLVANFESLDPANTLWKKYYNLYSKIDTEPSRFLGFENWWGGYFLMNREEIDAIVSELFIGNKLAGGGIVAPDGPVVDLKNIRSPIVIFASRGDNITPPQQALNWIIDVYGDENEIIANDQVIIYLIHENIGHLGIFVSGRVAAKEHKELVETLEMIDALPAGLYEMIIERKDQDAKYAELEAGDYFVRFESRRMDDIRSLEDTRSDEEAFQAVDAVSRVHDGCYKAFVAPYVRAMTTPWSAAMLRRLHPLRLQHELLSDQNPLLMPLASAAQRVRENRSTVDRDNPFLLVEQTASNMIETALDAFRDARDAWSESVFQWMYGPWGFGAVYPPKAQTPRRTADAVSPRTLSDDQFAKGGILEAILRMVAAAVIEVGVFDRRSTRVFRGLLEQSQFKDTKLEEIREMFKEQARLLRHDRDRALEALAVMIPGIEQRRLAANVVRRILLLAPEDIRVDRPLSKKLSEVLEIDLRSLQETEALTSV